MNDERTSVPVGDACHRLGGALRHAEGRGGGALRTARFSREQAFYDRVGPAYGTNTTQLYLSKDPFCEVERQIGNNVDYLSEGVVTVLPSDGSSGSSAHRPPYPVSLLARRG